ncbi:MAG TPA: alpha/beta fold hydrolase [Abditibacteriaceae bacterium]|nr:alpha/beta fold hydrolase [Abditibacteriaceae bacterium]
MNIQVKPGLRVEYEEAGQGSPVVLLHAFPLSHAMWEEQMDALSREFRVLAPALRGFGGTTGFAAQPSIRQMAEDLIEFLEALKIDEPLVLGGLSMGGYVALAFARAYPRRLRALVLADTRAEPDTEEGKEKRNQMIEFVRRHTPAEVIEKVLPGQTCDATRESRPHIVGKITDIATAQTNEALINALQALRDRPDARPWLGSIAVPALVIVGAEDALTPPTMAQTLVDGMPNAQLAVIESAGHLSNLEQPEAFNEAVLTFLRSLL